MGVIDFLNMLFENVLTELSTGMFLFAVGFLTSKVMNTRRKEKEGRIFEDSVQLAAQIIYDAEEIYPGQRRGPEKLSYAVKRFVAEAGIDDYEKAQNYIVQIFNMTRLSDEDFPKKIKANKLTSPN